MALRKRSRFRHPHAITSIRWILPFVDSAAALVALSTTALRMRSKWVLTIRAGVCTMGSSASLVNPTLGIEREATGYKNIMIRGLLLGLNRRTIRGLTPEIAEVSGLGECLRMPVHTYSTGMMMRLAFAIPTSVRRQSLDGRVALAR